MQEPLWAGGGGEHTHVSGCAPSPAPPRPHTPATNSSDQHDTYFLVASCCSDQEKTLTAVLVTAERRYEGAGALRGAEGLPCPHASP